MMIYLLILLCTLRIVKKVENFFRVR